jgi:hypothetical protein
VTVTVTVTVTTWGRRAVSLVAFAGLGGLTLAACQTDPHSSSCDFQQQTAQPGSPLTLLPGARLDRIGNGFVLLGWDAGARRVRWAPVSGAGQLGSEHSAALATEATAGPWFGVAGRSAPGDTILIAYGVPAPSSPGMVQVQVLGVPADGSVAPAPAGNVAVIPDPATQARALVAMGSGRSGMRAALSWTSPQAGATPVGFQTIAGDGTPVGGTTVLGDTEAPLVDCLSFVNGKDELAFGFLTRSATNDPNPTWLINESVDGKQVEPGDSIALKLGTENPTCPVTTATRSGYVIAWQNEIGSLIGFFDRTSRVFTSKVFAGAVTFGGADVQPPLAGLGPVGTDDYGVVLARSGAAEAWRVTADGVKAPGTVVLPSQVGQLGDISTVSLSGALYATYADYASAAAFGTAGQRFFVKIACF